jgi:hypothetical protein
MRTIQRKEKTMSKVTGLFIFVLGAAVGSAVTWQYAKNFYEQRAQEEIDSVKETYGKKVAPVQVEADTAEKEAATVVDGVDDKPDILHYAEILKNEQYTTDNESTTAENKPYVISPDEFGEFEEYDRISLTYYADQVLADENDDKIKDVDEVIGVESLTHFGEFEDDSVFVRNDRLKCDYEILMDSRTYSEVLKQKPHQKED